MAANTNKSQKARQRSKRVHERKKAADHITIYANNAQIVANFWDLRLSFGEIMEANEKSLVTEDKVTVIMSPQLAKQLAAILIDNVQKYEGQFGELPKVPG